MDLAPADKRGYFLGTWQATMDFGHLIGPLLVGAIAVPLGIPAAFGVIGGVLLCAAVFPAVSRTATTRTTSGGTPPP